MTEVAGELVETTFDPLAYAEVRINVRLPGVVVGSDDDVIFGYTQLIRAGDVLIQDPYANLPPAIERAARALEISMRFR